MAGRGRASKAHAIGLRNVPKLILALRDAIVDKESMVGELFCALEAVTTYLTLY